MAKKFCAKVLLGSDAVNRFYNEEPVYGDGMLVKREFETEAELKAYFQGLDDNDGWLEYATLNDKEYKKIHRTIDKDAIVE